MSLRTPCLKCGDLSPKLRNGLCDECKPLGHQTAPKPKPTEARANTSANGRGTQWIYLSKRARRLQPFCLDCGSRSNLEADHLPSAWFKHARSITWTLEDVEVVCGECNRARGSSKPGSQRYAEWENSCLSNVEDSHSTASESDNRYSGDGMIMHQDAQQTTSPSSPGDLPVPHRGVCGFVGTGEMSHNNSRYAPIGSPYAPASNIYSIGGAE